MIFKVVLNNIPGEVSFDIQTDVTRSVFNTVIKSAVYMGDTATGLIYQDKETIEAIVHEHQIIRNSRAYYISYKRKIIVNEKHFQFTHKSIQVNGRELPLFYSHELDSTATNVVVSKVTARGKTSLTDYLLQENTIYHNYQHTYKSQSDYTVYYISYMLDSIAYTSILSTKSTAREYSYLDVLEDGSTDESHLRYTLDVRTNDFVFEFNTDDKIYYRREPIDKRAVILKQEESWLLQVQEFSHVYHGAIQDYFYRLNTNLSSSSNLFINSFDYQIVRPDIIMLHSKIEYDPILYPLTIRVYDENETLINIFSSYSFTESSIQSQIFPSLDLDSSFVGLPMSLGNKQKIVISGFIKNIYHFDTTELNPLLANIQEDDKFVFFVQPEDTSLYYLQVRYDIIIDTNLPARALLVAGSLNTDTWAGTSYQDWLSDFSHLGTNGNRYLIICEIFYRKNKDFQLENIISNFSYDTYNYLMNMITAFNPDGLYFAKNGLVIVKMSRTLLETYGGSYTLQQLLEVLNTYKPVGKKAIIRWIEDPTLHLTEMSTGTQRFEVGGLVGYTYRLSKSYDNISWSTVVTTAFTTDTLTVALTEIAGIDLWVKASLILDSLEVNDDIYIKLITV